MWLNFIVLKFCLGSASEPNVCSHCYDVLNEETFYVKCDMEKRPLLRLTEKRGKQPPTNFVSCFENAWVRPLGQCVSDSHSHIRDARIEVNNRRIPCSAQVRMPTEAGMWLSFIVLKFRLGSASEPNVCSHCYDVLNEETLITPTTETDGGTYEKTRPFLCPPPTVLALLGTIKAGKQPEKLACSPYLAIILLPAAWVVGLRLWLGGWLCYGLMHTELSYPAQQHTQYFI